MFRLIFRELVSFIRIQCISALFAVLIIFGLAFTALVDTGIPRYDFMLGYCVLLQVLMVATKLETKRELLSICVFHFLGIMLEVYKVSHGSWRYPDVGLKLYGVPLYSGFMYASVASYLMQAWRRHNMTLENFPSWRRMTLLAVGIYANFFLSRHFGDSRWILSVVTLLIFGRTFVLIDVGPSRWRVNLLFGFLGLGTWVWIAEHLCTSLGAWQYPNQTHGWTWVDPGKWSSWCLLTVISFLAVAAFKLTEKMEIKAIQEPLSSS